MEFSITWLRPLGCETMDEDQRSRLSPVTAPYRFMVSDTNKENLMWVERHICKNQGVNSQSIRDRDVRRTMLAIKGTPVGQALIACIPERATWRPKAVGASSSSTDPMPDGAACGATEG